MTNEEYNEKKYKLEVYNAMYKAYADEIRNLWQRSAFLGVFMTLSWGGYGALQLKMIEKCLSNICVYHFASLGLCAVIIVLSLLWIAMAKGSKFVQEAHEAHIAKYNIANWLFCDLGKYQNGYYDTNDIQYIEYPTTKPLKPYRYSPSRINIFLGWFSGIISSILGFIHIIMVSIAHNNLEWLIVKLYLINSAIDYGLWDIFAFCVFVGTCMGLILHKANENNDNNNRKINKSLNHKGDKKC